MASDRPKKPPQSRPAVPGAQHKPSPAVAVVDAKGRSSALRSGPRRSPNNVRGVDRMRVLTELKRDAAELFALMETAIDLDRVQRQTEVLVGATNSTALRAVIEALNVARASIDRSALGQQARAAASRAMAKSILRGSRRDADGDDAFVEVWLELSEDRGVGRRLALEAIGEDPEGFERTQRRRGAGAMEREQARAGRGALVRHIRQSLRSD